MAEEQGSGTIPVVPVINTTATGLAGLSQGQGYQPPAAPAAPVPQTAEQQALSFLNDPQQLEMAAAARANGSEYSEISSDFRNMSFMDLTMKYGERAARQRINLVNADMAFQDQFNGERNLLQTGADTAIDVATGFTNIVGGIESAALGGLGAVAQRINPEWDGLSEFAVGTAETTNRISEFLASNQSERLRNSRDAAALMDSFDQRESQVQYEKEVDNGSSPILAGLRQFGRGVADSAETLYENPELAGSVIAQGIGSLGPSAKIAQGAAALVGRPSNAAARAKAINPTRANAARLAAARIAEASAVPVGIAVSEASGVYTQAVNQVMNMTESELAENSEAYVQMRNESLNHREAQIQIANDTGLLGVAVQLPVAALIGRATNVSRFETAPMNVGSFRSGLRELGQQTIEESLQGSSGELSSNYAMRAIADASQNLSEGVGEAFTEGAVGGFGMAGVLQGPGMAASAADAAVRGTVRGAQAGVNTVVQANNERRDRNNPVGDNATREAARRVEEFGQIVTQRIPESDIQDVVSISNDEILNMSDSVRGIIIPEEGTDNPNSRLGSLDRLVEAANSESLSEPVSREATLQAYMEMQKLQGFALNEIPAEIQSLSEDDPTRVAYQQAQSDVASITENPKYKKVIETAESMAQDTSPDVEIPPLTPEFVNETIALAMANPAGVNPRYIDAILNQEGSEDNISEDIGSTGPIDLSQRIQPMKLTESVRSRLTAAKLISEEMLRSIEIKDKIEQERVETINSSPTTETKIKPRKTKDIVRQEIHIDGKKITTKTGKERVLPSLNDFYRNIVSSIDNGGKPVTDRQGLPVDAQGSLEGLGNFAQHMKNKIEAFNKSAQGGKGEKISFRTLTPNGWINAGQTGSSKVFGNAKSPNSIALSREALVDAQSAVNLYNNMLNLFPQLQGTPLDIPVLDPSLSGVSEAGESSTEPTIEPTAVENPPPAQTEGDPNRTPPTERSEPVRDDPVDDVIDKDDDDFDVLEPFEESSVDPEDQAEQAETENVIDEEAGLEETTETNEKEIESVSKSDQTREEETLSNKMVYWNGIGLYLSIFDTIKDGGFIVREVSPDIGIYEFGYVTTKGERIAGTFEYNGYEQFIDNLIVTSEDGANKVGISQMRFLANKILKEFPEAVGVSGFRQSGARASDQVEGVELIFDLIDGKLVLRKTKDITEEITENESNLDEEAVEEIPLPDNLAQDSNGVSRFTRAYVIQKGKSLLSTLVQPLEYIIETFSSVQNMNDRSKNELNYNISASEREAFQKMLREDVPKIIAKMNARLNDVIFDKKSNSTVIDLLKSGKLDVTALLKGKVIAVVNPETGQYDQRMLDQATMAALHWVMTASTNSERVPSTEKAAEIFKVDEADVTQEMMNALIFGTDQTSVKEQLASLIEQFWGVSRNGNITMSDTRGISESIASELLTVMEGDYIKTEEFTVNKSILDSTTSATMKVVPIKMLSVTTNVPEFRTRVDSFGQLSSILGDIIVEGYEHEGGIIGKPPKKIVGSQKRNPFSRISEKQRNAIKTAQNIEFYRNSDFIDFMGAMGQKAFFEILGYVEANETNTNKSHLKSITGKNTSIRMGWDGVMEHDAAIKSYADVNNMDANDVPTYYNWFVTKVNRLHMLGFGPQSDKTAREALIATVSNLDMTKQEDINFFWMTVAQSLGMKTEKETKNNRGKTVQKAIDLVNESYPQSVSILENWLADKSKPLGSSEIQTIQVELSEGDEQTQKAMHALLAVAKLRMAEKTGGESLASFRHMLSLEADGKTDGPINAMMNFISGGFTQEQLNLLAKGGFFLNKREYSFGDHIATGDTDDLYMVAAQKLQTYTRQLRENFKRDNSPSLAYMDAFLRLSDNFGEIEFNEKTGEIIIGRNTLKNPLTVTVYGSGIDGITSKVSNALMEAIYENFTKVAQQSNDKVFYNEMTADMKLLFGTKTYRNRKTGKWTVDNRQAKLSYNNDPVNFEFTKEARQNFHTNVKELFVNQMRVAIDEMMGSTVQTMEAFQRATQVQSIVMIDWFQRRIEEKKEELIKSGELKKGEFLSQKDYDQIFKEMSKFGAIVENDDQTLNMGTSSKSEGSRPLSSNLEEKFRGNANMPAPTEAGVRAAPYITISGGDALMIDNIYAAYDAIMRSLPVFDGVEVAADEIDTGSEKINRAVAESWEQNPARDVSNSFNAFLRESPLKGLSPETVILLEENLGLEQNEMSLEESIQAIRDQLEQIANEIQARKDTIKEIAYSVDHMAGAGSAYTHDGEDLTGTPQEIIEQINDKYEANLKKNNATKPEAALEKENRKFRNLVKEYGSQNETNDVTTMYWEQFSSMMENNPELTPDQKRVYEVIKSSVDKDFTFIFGSKSEVTKYRNRVFTERSDGKSVPEGQIDTLNKVIYVTNISGETTLHELVHATTIGKVFDYYVDPSNLNSIEQDAVRRMEVLMNDFLNRTFDYDSVQTREVDILTTKAIQDNLALGTDLGMAAALNEFMAWSLTNQNLVDVTKTTRIRNPLAVIAQKVKKLMGRLVGGDIFSNMLFNTEVLLKAPRDVSSDMPGVVQLNQNASSDGPTRLSTLMDRFENKVAHWVRNRELEDSLATARYDHVLQEKNAKETINLFDAHGFNMNMEEASAFRSIQAAMATTIEVDGLVQSRMQKLYTYTMKQLSVESFMDDPESTNPNDRWLAEHRFNVISGAYGTVTDTQGNSNLLSSFVALSQTNEDFRKVLSKINVPKAISIDRSSVDGFLTSSANSMMDSLAITITREGRRNQTIDDAMDNLTYALSEIERDAQSYVEQSYNSLINGMDKEGAKLIARIGDEIYDRSETELRESSNKLKRSILQTGKLVGSLLSENKGEIVANAGIGFLNEATSNVRIIREFIAETIGITNENKGVLMHVNLVKKAVSSVRQDYRETLPEVLYSKFTKELTKQEKSMVHLAMGKTDIGALGEHLTVEEISELFKENINVINAVVAAEKDMADLDKKNASEYMRKAKQLANYMVNGVAGYNLLTNAEAIGRMLNEDTGPLVPSQDVIKHIDKLTTLYAVQNLDRTTKDQMSELAKEQSEGLEFMVPYLLALRTKEMEKVSNFGTEVARLNGYKGYIPSETQDGVQLVLRSDTEFNNLVRMGFTRVADYKGPGFKVGPTKMGYYYSAISGKATYSQGAMQTVQTSINGVDPRNGRTLTGASTGFLTGASVPVVNQKAKTQTKNNATETLIPRFGENGELVAFERSMDPDAMRFMNRNTDMGVAMGIWRGRQVEEEISKQYNEILVDRIKQMWDQAKVDGRTKEYTDISDSNDPIEQENWMMVPKEMKDYIESIFGDEGFMVRREVVNNALGYRMASIGDAWTGDTRLPEDARKVITGLASMVPNDKGYKYALLGERGIQSIVSSVKDLIIIRSMVVPIANIMSNQLQLMMRGVPVRNLAKKQRQYLIEINTYLHHEQRRVELEADIQANQNNPRAKRKAETELKSMRDFEKRMAIHPLIKAGEFSTIAEGMTDVDEALKNEKFYDWIEKQVDKLPEGLRTGAKYGIISKDTALYHGLARAVQYGDFLAKATFYDHLINQQKLSHDDALLMVTEEFVNYNLLPGRSRSYAESIGLLWFWNFKIRSMKVALRMMRQNPARVFLLGNAGPMIPEGVTNIGGPVSDNLLAVWEDDRLGYSVGLGMATNAPGLIPLLNLIN